MYMANAGDQKAAYYGGANETEDERRRRLQQAQGGQGQPPAPPGQQPPGQPPRATWNTPPAQRPPQQPQAASAQPAAPAPQRPPQQTFAQMQQSGQARPNPPAPAPVAQPRPYEAFAQQLTGVQQPLPTGTPASEAGSGSRSDPYLTSSFQMGQADSAPLGMGGGAPQFTGDLGAYLGGMLNAVPTQANVPQWQADQQLAGRANSMYGQAVPQAPAYTPNTDLATRARALTQSAGQVPGVSAAGIDPLAAGAATGGGAAATSPASAPAAAPAASPASPRGGVDALLNEALTKPSAFDNEEVMKLYGRLGQNIDDQYAQQQTALREEMAARGLTDSSIMGGRLADLNVGQRQARTELANQLATQRAQDYASARGNAIQMGLGAEQQRFGQGIAGADLGLRRDDFGLRRQGQQFGQTMQGLGFENELGQQDFANQMARAQFNLGAQGQGFGQHMQALGFQNQLGQQSFANQLAQWNAAQGFGQNAFNNQMALANALQGYGQQAFQNDMATANFNEGRRRYDDQFFQYLLGLGG